MASRMRDLLMSRRGLAHLGLALSLGSMLPTLETFTRAEAAPMQQQIGVLERSPAAWPLRSSDQKQQQHAAGWLQKHSTVHHQYVMEGVIGQGGFGSVHVGHHKGSEVPMAIKCVRKDRTTKAKFLQEAAILRQIGGHNHVIEFCEAFETTDSYVLVTELVQGGELYDSLINSGVFSESDGQQLARELATALSYLHANDVVHADLKPENILIHTENDRATTRLIDFGQAFREHEESERRRSMSSGIGTIAYAAPEFLEMRASGCAMDMWALGVVLYIVLCGIHPFDPTNDATDAELRHRIVRGQFDKQSSAWLDLSANAQDLIQRMLVVNPSDRIKAKDVLAHEWVAPTVRM